MNRFFVVTDLRDGADPNRTNKYEYGGVTPCLWAAFNGNPDCIRALADGGPAGKLTDGDHINAVATGGVWEGKTALDLACLNGHTDVVRVLLQHGQSDI